MNHKIVVREDRSVAVVDDTECICGLFTGVDAITRAEGFVLKLIDDELIALLRNAFFVQMRRGWGVTLTLADRWLVTDKATGKYLYHERHHDWFAGENPAKALVDADDWWKANIDKVEAKP